MGCTDGGGIRMQSPPQISVNLFAGRRSDPIFCRRSLIGWESSEAVELIQGCAEVLGHGGLEAHGLIGGRVKEAYGLGVDAGAFDEGFFGAATAGSVSAFKRRQVKVFGGAVFGVHGQGHSGGGEVDSDLGGHGGAGAAFEEGVSDEVVAETPLGYGGPAGLGIGLPLVRRAAATPDGYVDGPRLLDERSADECDVADLQAVPAGLRPSNTLTI